MDLITARFITNKSQQNVEKKTGVFQTKLSRFEKNGTKCIRDDEKKKIEKYLGFKINWIPEKQTKPLTKDEQEAIEPFIKDFTRIRGERETRIWLKSFKSGREIYNAVMDIINNTIVNIPMPKIKWEKVK